jgi:hypothetical protein
MLNARSPVEVAVAADQTVWSNNISFGGTPRGVGDHKETQCLDANTMIGGTGTNPDKCNVTRSRSILRPQLGLAEC